jgi:hypothetical protein
MINNLNKNPNSSKPIPDGGGAGAAGGPPPAAFGAATPFAFEPFITLSYIF